MPTILERKCAPPFPFEPGTLTTDDGLHSPFKPESAIDIVDVACYMRKPAQINNVYLILTYPSKLGCVAVIRKAWVDKFELKNGLVIETDFEEVPFCKGFGYKDIMAWGYPVVCREPDFVLWSCDTDTAKDKLIAGLEAAKAFDAASVVELTMVMG